MGYRRERQRVVDVAVQTAVEAIEGILAIDGGGDLQLLKEYLKVDGTGDLKLIKDELIDLDDTLDIFEGTSSGVSTAVTCGGTSVTALAASATRRFAIFVNDSDEAIYLSIDGGAAVAHEGIRLNAAGGAFEINATNLYTGLVTAIATNASKVLTVSSG